MPELIIMRRKGYVVMLARRHTELPFDFFCHRSTHAVVLYVDFGLTSRRERARFRSYSAVFLVASLRVSGNDGTVRLGNQIIRVDRITRLIV